MCCVYIIGSICIYVCMFASRYKIACFEQFDYNRRSTGIRALAREQFMSHISKNMYIHTYVCLFCIKVYTIHLDNITFSGLTRCRYKCSELSLLLLLSLFWCVQIVLLHFYLHISLLSFAKKSKNNKVQI